MAVLSESQRIAVWEKWMRDNLGYISITKPELKAAVDAIDNFLESNSTAVNNAFPTPAKQNLTSGQKAMVVAYVAMKRWS